MRESRSESSYARKSKVFDSKKRRSTHICELSRGSDSNLLKLQPTASLRARLKRFYQKLIIVTVKHPTTRFYLRSQAAIAFEKKRHGRSPHWWVIHPCSVARFCWQAVMTVTYLYCFVLIPYVSAFYMLNTRSYHKVQSMLLPAYFICILDIGMNFITGYASLNSHEIFLDPGLIASHYVRGYFLIDLLSSIPYSWILQDYHSVPDGENSNFSAIMIELLPLIKLFRIHTLYRSLNQIMQVLGLGHIGRLMWWLAILSLFFCHWAACFSYGLPIIVMHATKLRFEDSSIRIKNHLEITDPKNNAFNLYLYSFYSGLTSLFAVDTSVLSNGDVKAEHSAGETCVTCVLLIFGAVYQVYLIVVILQLVESENAPDTRYRQMINNLKFYIREKRVPPKLEKKLLNYYEYKFQDRYFKEDVIVGSLADHLREEIVMHNCRYLMSSVALFCNLPKPLIASIVAALKSEIFLPNDVIFKCEDEGNCMYFIGKGTLAVLTYAGKEICHLEDGAYFGESSLVYPGLRRAVTVIAVEECELFRFDRKDFKRLIPVNSDVHQRLKKVVKDQVAILMQIEKEEMGPDPESSLLDVLSEPSTSQDHKNTTEEAQ